MLFDSNQGEHLRELQEQIDRARTMTAQLMAQVIARACARLQAQQQSASARIIRLVQSGASADATLALLELELPQWKLRRLIYDHGEWHCSLSKHIALPAELDDMAEANHESLPLAILSAFVEARRHSVTAGESRPQSVPQVRSMQLRQFRLIRQSRDERAMANSVGSTRNDGRRPQPIVISVGIVLLAALVLVSAGLVAIPLWTVLVQGWRLQPIADQCNIVGDAREGEACDQKLREGVQHPARGANAPIRLRSPQQRNE
jgi:hypothetical protein